MNAAPAAPAQAQLTYEFTAAQNAIIARLAFRMRFVGGVLVALALLFGVRSFLPGVHDATLGLEIGIAFLLIGWWSARAGRELRRVAATRGADIPHLMNALGEIWKLYEFQFWVFIGIAAILAVTLLMIITGWEHFPSAW